MKNPAARYWTVILSVFLSVHSFSLAAAPEGDVVGEDSGQIRRVTRGLVALYDFSGAAEDSGNRIADRSRQDLAPDLMILKPAKAKREDGSVTVRGNSLIKSKNTPRRLNAAIKKANEITLELWLKPLDLRQSGPARIVTLSKDSTNRNLTIGQDGNRFDVRLRTTSTSANGLPSLASKKGTAKKRRTHIVYTRNRNGVASIYVDGKLNATKEIGGDLSNWDSSFELGLGDELSGGRGWRGTFELLAIYKRALSAEDVQRNFGANAGEQHTLEQPLARKRDARELHFELEVAPILSNHCLECHDSLSSKGELDLSRKAFALKGGESGTPIVAGSSATSLLWEFIESDEMPLDRPPLSKQEKQVIKKWLDDGAVWSMQTIDPAVYVHGGRPDANWVRRLTIPEYVATIQALFEIDVSKDAEKLLPPDVRADGFSNTAYNLAIDLKHVEAYQQLAQIVVGRIDQLEFARKFRRNLSFTDNAMGDLIEKMGKRIFRGPVSDDEVIAYRGISTTLAATEDGSLSEAIGLLLEAMLQSPRFLYRIETQRGDGDQAPLNEYELASRLSYMVWGAPPDENLIQAAEDGDLYDSQSIRDQVSRMLKDPRAIDHSKRFFAEWLNLDHLQNMQPNREKFPKWDPALADDMRAETLAFFEEVVWKHRRPLSNLLNARLTIVTPRLAKHYGLPVKALPPGEKSVYYDLSDKNRGGLLTQGSLLTVGGDEASMVTRGLLVMDELLRGVVKDPPPCVDTTPVPTKPGLSQRAIAEQRIANTNCGGCHSRFEPLAFGLEQFDGLGGFHETDEHGNDLRADGEIAFPGADKSVQFRTSRELMDLMAGNDRVKESITWKLTQYAMGRPLTAVDASVVQAIHREAMANGGTYEATISAIAASELVTTIQTDR